MPTSPVSRVIEHIRRAVPSAGDGELLGRFVDRRDETALAALVQRHGPMVWGVCRRRLGHHDAEDAFQATFLVLVRKAASVRPREMVGNWLYGVARQAAVQARSAAGRRAREVQVVQMPDTEAPPDRWADVRPILDEELSRLPDHYRAVVVLCDLEGRTRTEVAGQFGCPDGTVASRLARAREMLARRLAARGVALSGGVLAAALSRNVASAGVPTSVVMSTIKAANLGQVPVKVAAIADGVLKAMLMSKLKAAVAVVLVLGFLAIGATGVGIAGGQTKGDAPPASEPKAQKVEHAVVNEKVEQKEAVAWGKEVDGLQAGLAADASTIRQGEKLKLTVKLRNVGKAAVTVTYGVLRERTPQVTTDTGGRVSVYMPPPFDNYAVPTKRALKPGETITLYNPEVAVESEALTRLKGLIRVDQPTICVEPGKYKIGFGGLLQSHPKLGTGTVEFEVKDQVAWGKEAGGLQAGIVGPGVVRIGEKARFAVKLRNVSKETIKVSAWPLWMCYPGVVDARGKRVPTTTAPAVDFYILPMALTLKPGETVDVGRSHLLVAEPDEKVTVPDGVVDFCAIHVAPGKYTAGCIGFLKENHTLETATVEFEVKPASVTAWGEEVGGLQAGLGIAEKRVYHTGETVTLSVRVRNLSKEAVKFRYCRETYFEEPPAVTDSKGKPIPLERDRATGFAALVPVNLAPGKEIEVGERQLELKPTLYGTGTFSVQYERLETPENDKSLSKLATGKLELEVKDEVPPGKTDRPAGSRASGASPDSKAAYPTADIVVQYRDESGREVRDLQQFRVEDTETVAELASHFPGILGDRGSGPRTTAGKRATFTIKFNHKSGDVSGVRVAHISADYTTWWWRDNPPYTGDREVEGKDQLKSLMEGLAAKNKVDLK